VVVVGPGRFLHPNHTRQLATALSIIESAVKVSARLRGRLASDLANPASLVRLEGLERVDFDGWWCRCLPGTRDRVNVSADEL
jgi:hypothetical protein